MYFKSSSSYKTMKYVEVEKTKEKKRKKKKKPRKRQTNKKRKTNTRKAIGYDSFVRHIPLLSVLKV